MADGTPLYELSIREWQGTDSFVAALVKAVQPTEEAYIRGVLEAMANKMIATVPVKTGELRSSIRVEVSSPTRGKVLMAAYGVWVDRGHRVIMRSKGRYRTREDRGVTTVSKTYLWRTRAANFIRDAINSPEVQAARENVAIAFRRRQSD